MNASLPRERQLRVLLADPPVDWAAVQKWEDLDPWMAQRDRYPAELIRREVIANQRRALIIYGDGHLFRVPIKETIIRFLQNSPAVKVSTIAVPISADLSTVQADVAPWAAPSLALLRGTGLGTMDFNFYYPPPMILRDGKPVSVILDQWRSLRLEDQVDALLYLGPPASMTMTRLAPELCADAAYMEMRLRRMALNPFGQGQVDGLKRYCATALTK